MLKKIAVIGATGMIGKPVTQQLIKAGFDISILARNTQKATKEFPGTKVIEADVFDPLGLLKALEGQDAVYINLSPPRNASRSSIMTEREGINNIVDAAKHLQLKRIILLSSLVQNYNGMNGFKWWIFDIKEEAVKKVKASGIPYTIFYPSTFMETIPRDLIKGNKMMLTTGSVARMWMITAGDFAKQVARALQIAEGKNQEYNVQGPEPFTWDECAKVLLRNSRRKLSVLKAPIGMLKVMGYLVPSMNYGWHICEALNKYPEKFDSEITWRELGRPEITLEQFAKSME
jgi:uncharacterized protein YbjT (DUF2867 family)